MTKYIVNEGSDSGHCCFEATVVDTQRPQMIRGTPFFLNGVPQYQAVCETFEKADAELIRNALNALSPEAMQQLKELRMWHWRHAMTYRSAADSVRKLANNGRMRTIDEQEHYSASARAQDKNADFHIKACQALNNILPGSGEYDCAEADSVKLIPDDDRG